MQAVVSDHPGNPDEPTRENQYYQTRAIPGAGFGVAVSIGRCHCGLRIKPIADLRLLRFDWCLVSWTPGSATRVAEARWLLKESRADS